MIQKLCRNVFEALKRCYYLLHGRADWGQHLECLAHHVNLAIGLSWVILVVNGSSLAWLGLIMVNLRLSLGVWRQVGGAVMGLELTNQRQVFRCHVICIDQ